MKRISHFKILEPIIGRGGMGSVSKALDERLGRLVAIKFLELDDDRANARERFHREAKTAASLDHPNICPVFQTIDVGKKIAIVMAFCEGGTLQERMDQGAISPNEAISITTQVARGLKYAASRGIIHRDIKPKNIMFKEGVVKIVDFGIARWSDLNTLTGPYAILGTLSYMSPEQCDGLDVNEQADVWSLGVVLYEMLARQKPFQGKSTHQIKKAIDQEDPQLLKELNPQVPLEIEAIVNRGLHKDLSKRYTWDKLLADLEPLERKNENNSFISTLVSNLKDVLTPAPPMTTKPDPMAEQRVFLVYQHEKQPDMALAKEMYRELSKKYTVYMDTDLTRRHWGTNLKRKLHSANFLVCLISDEVAHNELFLEKIGYGMEKQETRITLLPIRVGYTEPLPYPLDKYADGKHYALWMAPKDTPALLEALRAAIETGSPLRYSSPISTTITEYDTPLTLPKPAVRPPSQGGAIPVDSHYYIRRRADKDAESTIETIGGATISIIGPRQIGKSSLLIRIINKAAQLGKHTVFMDLQDYEKTMLRDMSAFYRELCLKVTETLGIDDRTQEFWDKFQVYNQRCIHYFEYILQQVNKPVVLAIDEVDRLITADYYTDFFAMLRSWHNKRADQKLWRKLDLALVTSTEPVYLLPDEGSSPFNVGEVLELEDFSPDQVSQLSSRHGNPVSREQLSSLVKLLGGHPYLTCRALSLIAGKRYTLEELLDAADREPGPFTPHLRQYLFRLAGKEGLRRELKRILKSGSCEDEVIADRLKGLGLVRREVDKFVPRCELYRTYFRKHLYV